MTKQLKWFGTDGIRGVANQDLTPELAMQVGRAGAFALTGQLGRPPKILLGTDTRISADMLEAAILAGLCSVGAFAYRVGVVPSPAMAYLVRLYEMDAGVMLSASHNPMPDNGIKFFDRLGYKLSDEIEDEIEELIQNSEIPRSLGGNVGHSIMRENAVADYVNFLTGTIHNSFEGLKVGLDCANGACFETAPPTFERLGAKIFPINHRPTGININLDCGSTHLQAIKNHVLKNELDVGFAFDGDGDRVLCVDELGQEMDGDAIMAICALSLKQKNMLQNNTIVATVMSNMGLQIFCDREKIALRRTAVGDRYVIQDMQKGGYNLGGEQSGHIIFKDYNTTGDGILTALQLLDVIVSTGQKLSELRTIISALPQVLLGAKIKKKAELSEYPNITNKMQEIEEQLGTTGRLLVRASGTEPLIRVMIEGPDQTIISRQAEDLVALIEERLG
ncbi:MAG: phosphoglucosamine mutase [Turicibacter sp.]|nr:phosphoglucosamine mutase [Turicibacter sp.]